MPPKITRDSLHEELGNNLQIGLGTGLIGGGLLGFLAAAATLALNPVLLRATGDAIRLVLGLQFVYLILCLILGFVAAGTKTLLFLTTGRRISDTKTAAFASGVAFFILGVLYSFFWCRWHRIGGLAPSGPVGWRQTPVLIAILVIGLVLARVMTYAFYLLIVYVKKPERRRPGDVRRVYLIVLYMAAVFVLFIAVMRVTSGGPSNESGLTRESINPNGRRTLLLAVDGMTRRDLERLRTRGLLAWSDRFLSGSVASVVEPQSAVPPMLWTEVATGKDLAATGTVGFQTQMVKGLSTPLQIGPNQVGLFELFHSVLPFFHLTREVPVKSYMRETKGLWNMASDAGKTTVAVDWWISWPAERVQGAVVSDHAWLKLCGAAPEAGGLEAGTAESETAARAASAVQTPGPGMEGAMVPLRPDGKPLFLERETWPPTLLIELGPFARDHVPDSLAVRYGQVPPPDTLAAFARLGIPSDVLRSDLFYAQSAAWLLDRRNPDLWMLYLPGPDIIRRVLGKSVAGPSERERRRQEALESYWRALDPALLACFGAGGDTAVVAPEEIAVLFPGERGADLSARADSGLFALVGPGESKGRLTHPVRPVDMAPTILWLLGLPAAKELDGAPRVDVLTPESAASLLPVRWIPSYGRASTRDLERAASTLDEEMLERFKSLGYIQ